MIINVKFKIFGCDGMATLPTVVALTILLLIFGVLINSISNIENFSTNNLSDSDKALFFAQAGAKDALEKIVRNKNYIGNYNVAMSSDGCSAALSGCVKVAVGSSEGLKIIDSEGQVNSLIRRVKITVSMDSNGLVTGYNWQER